MTNTINGLDLGIVTSEKPKWTSDLDVQTFPFNPSPATYVDSYNGVKQYIIVKGTMYEATMAAVMDRVFAVAALQDGSQVTPYIFHSDMRDQATGNDGNVNVKIEDFEVEFMAGHPNIIMYTLTLYESV
jgi:hypothetical protein